MADLREALLRSEAPDSKKRQEAPCLYGLTTAECPAYMQYPYVLSGYRFGGTYKELLRYGLTTWHTETVNAHTVLLNAVLCTIACIAAIRWALLAVLPVAVWHVFAVLALSVLVHMPFSLGYHLFLPMDAVTSNLWRRLDICAIFAASALLAYAMSALVLPAGATAALSAAAALVAVAAAWKTWQLQPDQRLADIKTTHALFVGCGCVLYCTPMVVQVARDVAQAAAAGGGFSSLVGGLSAASWCAAGTLASLTLSSLIYAGSWPERLAPGRFDCLGNSHQLMHVGIMAATACEFGFLLDVAQRCVGVAGDA